MNNIKIKLKTSELTGAALDGRWRSVKSGMLSMRLTTHTFTQTDWALGGPIIEREKMCNGQRFEWWLDGFGIR
jgi:hypothetical protein